MGRSAAEATAARIEREYENEVSRLRAVIQHEIIWLDDRAKNYGGHPGETLSERADELRKSLTTAKCGG